MSKTTNIILILLLLFIILIIKISFTDPKIKDGKYTFAVITKFKLKAGSGENSVFTYSVNNKKYSFWGFYNKTLIIGDKFQLLYDKTNPNKSIIFPEKPIFLKDEKIKSYFATVIRIKKYRKKQVHFKYYINNKEYTRIQYLPDSFSIKSDSILNRKYRIIYWSENPQRSIIFLDKPVK
jgi:hypothetical protein